VGGPIAAVRDGDEILIDIPARKLKLKLSDEEIRNRLKGWKPVEREIPSGFMRRYVKLVSSAAKGAVLE
ncbi:MAG: dihydroxy-acid dehydratase, partial [Anaerolineae bacterium]